MEWKPEWGDIKTFSVSVIAEKLGCSVADARALKYGEAVVVDAPDPESEEDNGGQ